MCPKISPMHSGRVLRFAAFLIFSSSIMAGTELYSSRNDYQLAINDIGLARNTDFRTRDDGMLMTSPASDIHISSLLLRGAVFNNGRSYYNQMLYTFPNAEIGVSFPTGTKAFGVDLRSFYDVSGDFTITLSNGEVLKVPKHGSAVFFFGVVTDEPIEWVKFSFDNDYIVLDNFTFVPVPKPCSATPRAIDVAGSDNPWLAGMPQGSTDGGFDSVPGQSPAFADVSQSLGGIRISATGVTTNCPGCISSSTPDGGTELTGHFWGSVNGMGNIVAPLNSLIGVFISDYEPNTTPPPAGYVDYTSAASRDYSTLTPALKQPFFIGNGLRSSGELQTIIPPSGATRLYLGSMDGYEWSNNGGSFSVVVDSCLDEAAPVSTLVQTPNNTGWNNSNVEVEITANDGSGSGVESITFSSTGAQSIEPTTVPGASAALTISNEGTTIVSYFAEDAAGNEESVRTVEIKIDKTSPDISIVTPRSGSYLLNASVSSEYTCSDLLSGISKCEGTVPSGSQIDTSSVGTKSFSVTAKDVAGNERASSVNYTISYALAVLYDQTKAVKAGGTVPIRLQLLDANGANFSSPSVSVTAVSLIQVSSQASTSVEVAGNSNPDLNFRYDAALNGYIFNLKTTGLNTGSYVLKFVVDDSSELYSIGFQVRQ